MSTERDTALALACIREAIIDLGHAAQAVALGNMESAENATLEAQTKAGDAARYIASIHKATRAGAAPNLDLFRATQEELGGSSQ